MLVGQGSINGPTLFIAFFNDSDPLTEEIISLNFADDKKLADLINCTDEPARRNKQLFGLT